jgi:hypothetical protein
MTAGGALYNNLDYSFTADNEDGSFAVAPGQPGGGGAKLRSQLSILKSVFGEIDFIKMEPVNYTLQPRLPEKATVRIIAEMGKQYLVYINNWHPQKEKPPIAENLDSSDFSVPVELPSGNYSCEWIDPINGKRTELIVNGHKGGEHTFIPASLKEDLVLLIKKQL